MSHDEAGGNRSRLVRLGLAAALVSRVFSRVAGIVLVTALARYADPHTVAVYGYLLGVASLVLALTDAEVGGIAAREVATGRMPVRNALLSAAIPQSLSLAVAAILTIVLTIGIGPGFIRPLPLAITVGCVVLGGSNELIAELLRGDGRPVLEGLLQMAASVLLVVGGVWVVRLHGHTSALLAVVLLKEMLLFAVGLALIKPSRGPGLSYRHLLRQGLWLALAGTVSIGLWRQGMLITGAQGNVRALAVYVLASRYLDAGIALAHIAAVGLRPGLCALAEHPAELRRVVRRCLGTALAVGAAVSGVGLLAVEPLVSIPFGTRWPDAEEPVRAIALAAPMILLAFVAETVLVARNQTRLVAGGSIAGTVIGVLLSLALMRRHPGPLSPIIGTAVGTTAMATISLYGLRDLLTSAHPGTAGTTDPSEASLASNSTEVGSIRGHSDSSPELH